MINILCGHLHPVTIVMDYSMLWSFTSCNHSDGLFCVMVIHICITVVIRYKERNKPTPNINYVICKN